MGSGLSEAARAAAAAVDENRLWQTLMDLAAIGARPDGGVCRHALSDEDIAARALLIGWAESRGFEASVDEAANLFIRRPGRDADAAPVLAGSHMDSQPAGGKFDGVYGVLVVVFLRLVIFFVFVVLSCEPPTNRGFTRRDEDTKKRSNKRPSRTSR